ncbi:unnamed protein product [Pleuronectes platessa]|uniref:Uncharacterized protein n=1 Tax=Pleuronectes platessa TaxID=8262 RepID=A0A9N7TVU8_PLEPL|nr:unnamed protein product [Pleuronectes platessa]
MASIQGGGSALSSHSSNNAPLSRPHIYQSRASLSRSRPLSLLFFLSAIFIQPTAECKEPCVPHSTPRRSTSARLLTPIPPSSTAAPTHPRKITPISFNLEFDSVSGASPVAIVDGRGLEGFDLRVSATRQKHNRPVNENNTPRFFGLEISSICTSGFMTGAGCRATTIPNKLSNNHPKEILLLY